MGFIYEIRNLSSGKCYIGQSRQKREQDRWCQHKHNAFVRKSSRIAIYDAMRSYGVDKFSYTILCRVDDDKLNDVERMCIAERNTRVPNGYNITPGGDHNPHSEETKRKIGEKSKGRKITKPPLTEEQKKRIGDASRGRKHSGETKQRLSDIHKERYRQNPNANGCQRYSDDDVRYIRNNPEKMTQKQLAERFSTCFQNISRIQHRQTYKHVSDASTQN